MRVTPLDIRKQEFRKTMRGLDSDEVYAFLNTVADEYEAVLSDNKKLREHIVELEERLKEYKNIEMNLRNTLLTAEKVTAEAKENARREAGLIVREAEVEAEKAAEGIRAHTMQLRREILELKKQKDNYLNRLKTLLESHRRVFEGFEEDFSHVDREIEEIGKKVEEDVRHSVPPPRMSRKKITEEFSHGPEAKVTWGDESKEEEKPRPSVPPPDWQGEKGGELKASAPDGITDPAPTFKTPIASSWGATPSKDPGAGAVPSIKTEPIGAVDKVIKPAMPRAQGEEAGVGIELEDSDDKWDNGETRRSVARSIEEKLYPEVDMKGDGGAGAGSPPGAVFTPETWTGEKRADQPSQATQTAPATEKGATGQAGDHGPEEDAVKQESAPPTAEAERPAPGAHAPADGQAEHPAHQQDSWKQYEVRDEKPDWSNYEIPEGAKVPEAGRDIPSENEVERALLNLTEATGSTEKDTEVPETPQSAAPQKKGAPKETQAAADAHAEDGAPSGAEPARSGAPAVPPKKSSQETNAGEAGSTWSMEELRKNLTNFGQDED